MPFVCLAEASHHCTVALPGGERAVLRRFLQRPKRSMAALLTRQRMDCKGDGRFLYASRPFQILRFEIKPEVTFAAQWSDQAKGLEIAFETVDAWPWRDSERHSLQSWRFPKRVC